MHKFKVLIAHHHPFELWNAPPWTAQRLEQEVPGVRAVWLPDYSRVQEEIADADAFIGWSLRAEQFKAARRLRWIHSPAAAVHQLMIPEIVASDVLVSNAREVHGPVVAEHALALLLALAKRLPRAMAHQRERRWAQQMIWDERPRPREVAGGAVLIFGYGSIGREFAKRAKAMGMRVIAVREHAESPSEGADAVYAAEAFADALRQADYVLLAAPVTPRTTAIINEQTLAAMKAGAYLINVSRGPLIDDAALIAALKAKRIGGAALDVFTKEPLDPASPYWELDNVLISPHIAALTEKLWERHYELIRRDLLHLLAGEPLDQQVDKAKGY